VMKFSGRDALLRVRDSKSHTDSEHRVPTESGLQSKPIPLNSRDPPKSCELNPS